MVIVMMGVCGCGKTVIGELLADTLGFTFAEGDRFHPPANVEKMRSGIPLDDDDRLPWLRELSAAMGGWLADGRHTVLACSALKKSYREVLRESGDGVVFVHLKGSEELISGRLSGRNHEYMPASLLASQFAALEEPDVSENTVTVDISGTPGAIVAEIAGELPPTE